MAASQMNYDEFSLDCPVTDNLFNFREQGQVIVGSDENILIRTDESIEDVVVCGDKIHFKGNIRQYPGETGIVWNFMEMLRRDHGENTHEVRICGLPGCGVFLEKDEVLGMFIKNLLQEYVGFS